MNHFEIILDERSYSYVASNNNDDNWYFPYSVEYSLLEIHSSGNNCFFCGNATAGMFCKNSIYRKPYSPPLVQFIAHE